MWKIVAVSALCLIGCDESSTGSEGEKEGKSGATATKQGAHQDPRTMSAEEFLKQPLPPDGPSQNPSDYPAPGNEECNISPMRPEGFPELGRTVQISGPDRVDRQFISMVGKKGAGIEEWERALQGAGFKTRIFSSQSRFSNDDEKIVLAVKGPDVAVGQVQHADDMPATMAMFEYARMKHDMEFLVKDSGRFELMGLDFNGDDGLDVAYAIDSKDAVVDLKGLKELEGKLKEDPDKAMEHVASHGADIYRSWEQAKKDYKALLKGLGVEGKQRGDQVFRISGDFLIRFFPPQGMARDWKPSTEGKRVFVVDYENEGC